VARQHILGYLVPYDKHNMTAMMVQDVTTAVAATPVSTSRWKSWWRRHHDGEWV